SRARQRLHRTTPSPDSAGPIGPCVTSGIGARASPDRAGREIAGPPTAASTGSGRATARFPSSARPTLRPGRAHPDGLVAPLGPAGYRGALCPEEGMKLSDLKVVVTGGASGMGRCFAVELARGGAAVVIADLDEEKMGETVAMGRELPGSI